MKGGGNYYSVLCAPCVGQKSNKDNQITENDIDLIQTTTKEQQNLFLDNIEVQVQNLLESSSKLKSQNSKKMFAQSLNWINANQLVLFDLMIFLKKYDHDTIEIFEECILKMLKSIENVLKKDQNTYMGYLIASQAAIYASCVYRFFMSNHIDQIKIEKLQAYKISINAQILLLLHQIDKLKLEDYSVNFVEQSVKIIEWFSLALPECTFKPILNFVGGLGKMIATGGTQGWDDMIKGVKEGVTLIVNKCIHQESIDNFLMFINFERVKYSIIKILLDKSDIQKKENQIKEILTTIGKKVENNFNWIHKYYFVQILVELVLYQPIIQSDKLQSILIEKKFPHTLGFQEIWDELIKNNWLITFSLSEEQEQEIGFLKLNRTPLVINSQVKQKKQKTKKDKTIDNKDNFSKDLNEVLLSCEPVSENLRKFIINGEQSIFKGLLSYYREGIEEPQSLTGLMQSVMCSVFQGKDPVEVVEISIKKILNFACEFFKQQFQGIAINSEAQVRHVFITAIRSDRNEIVKFISENKNNFQTVLMASPKLKLFETLLKNLGGQINTFIDKIISYSTSFKSQLKQIQNITNILQSQTNISIEISRYLAYESDELFHKSTESMESTLINFQNQYDQMLQKMMFDSEEQTMEEAKNFVKIKNIILNDYEKIKIFGNILLIDLDCLNEPLEFKRLEGVLKKISISEQAEVKQYLKNLCKTIFQSDQIQIDMKEFMINIRTNIDKFKQHLDDQQASIDTELLKQQKESSKQPQNTGQYFFYIKMVNEYLLRYFQKSDIIINMFKALQLAIQQSNTTAMGWVHRINNQIQNILKSDDIINVLQPDNNNLSQQLEKQILEETNLIEQNQIKDEIDNNFLMIYDQANKIMSDLFEIIEEIFHQIGKFKFQSEMQPEFLQPLEELKNYMGQEVEQIQETLLNDIQDVFSTFQSSIFSKSISQYSIQLKDFIDLVDISGLMSILQDKFTDHNWKIRDRLVLILFDLNKCYGGEGGDPVYAQTLVLIKAKETNPNVQQTLKNEQLLDEMKSILQQNWKSQEKEIKNYIQHHFKLLEEKLQAVKDDKGANKMQMLKVYEKHEKILNQQLDNITDIGSLAGIQIEFLKDLKRQIFKLQQSVEEVKELMLNVSSGMLLLKGKHVYQMMEERRQKIFCEEQEKKFRQVNVHLTVSNYSNNQKISNDVLDLFKDEQGSGFIKDIQFSYMKISELISIYEQQKIHTEQLKKEKQEAKLKKQNNEELKPIVKNIMTMNRTISINRSSIKIDRTMSKLGSIHSDSSPNKDDMQIQCGFEEQSNSIIFPDEQDEDHQPSILKQIINLPTAPLFSSQIIKQNALLGFLNKNYTPKLKQTNILKRSKNLSLIEKFLEKNYNSMLIHGISGCGKTFVAEQIEYEIWNHRILDRYDILDIIKEDEQMPTIFKDLSIDEILRIVIDAGFISKDGQFTELFIEIEGEMEDAKQINSIQKQKYNPESESEEVGGVDLDDVQAENTKKILNTKFLSKLEFIEDDNVKRSIYKLLDRHFQLQPYPIYVNLSKINQPQNSILKETLSSQQYNFDENQIRNFRELASKGQINVVFLIDGYHELKQEHIGINIFDSNDFDQLKDKNSKSWKYPKIVTLCRTSHLSSDDYAQNFYAKYDRIHQDEYQPEQSYLEFQINELVEEQIQDHFKQKFIISLKLFCYKYFEKSFNTKILNSKDELERVDLIRKQFDQFWAKILAEIYRTSQYDKLWMEQNFTDFIMQRFIQQEKEKVLISNLFHKHMTDYQKHLKKIFTQRMYDSIVKNVKIIQLVNTPFMMSIFLEAIGKLIYNLRSKDRIKTRILNAIDFYQILDSFDPVGVEDGKQKSHNKKKLQLLKPNDIIKLLTIGEFDLLENFELQKPREWVQQKIIKLLEQNQLICENKDLKTSLTVIILQAIYDQNITRFELYYIFITNYIKQQIKKEKESGILNVSESILEKDCLMFSSRLASTFLKFEIYSYQLQDQSKLYQKKSIWDEFFDDIELPIRKTVRQCIPIISNGNQFSFMHISLMDFIIANEYYEVINALNIDNQLIEIMITFINQANAQAHSDDLKTAELRKQSDHLPQDQDQMFLEKLVNNHSYFEKFYKFYQKNTDSILSINNLKETIEVEVQHIKNIIHLQLNQKHELYKLKNKGICNFLMDKLKVFEIPDQSNRLCNNLYSLIQLARIDKRLSITASNAIGLLIFKTESFNKVNFSSIDLSGANFQNGQFHRCIFKDTNLSQCNLSQSFFYKCKFKNTIFIGANLSNCSLSKSKFINCNFKNVQIGTFIDIQYNLIDNNQDLHKLQYILIDPLDNDSLIIFNTYIVYRVDFQSGTVKLQQSFTQPFNQLSFTPYQDQNFFITGTVQEVQLIRLNNLTIVERIPLKKIHTILRCVQSENQEIIISGSNQTNNYVEIAQFSNIQGIQGISRIINDQCNYMFLNPENNQLICYYKIKSERKKVVYVYNYVNNDYILKERTQIYPYAMFNLKFQTLKQYQHQKLNLEIKSPQQTYFSLQEIKEGKFDIIIEKIVKFQNKMKKSDGSIKYKKEIKRNVIDSIKTYKKDEQKYGKASQILLNIKYPNQIMCAYQFGMIRKFQIQNSDIQYDRQDSKMFDNIQFILQVKRKDTQFLTCLNDNSNGIVSLRKFQYHINQKQQKSPSFLEIVQFLNLKTKKNKNFFAQDKHVHFQVLGMINHDQLLQEFILIVLEGKQMLHRYIIHNDLEIGEKPKCVQVQTKDINNDIFQNYSIDIENYDIFFFSYMQDLNYFKSQFIVYNMVSNQKLKTIQFDMQPKQSLDYIFINQNKVLDEIYTCNFQGIVNVYKVDKIEYDSVVQKEIAVDQEKQKIEEQITQKTAQTQKKTMNFVNVNKNQQIDQISDVDQKEQKIDMHLAQKTAQTLKTIQSIKFIKAKKSQQIDQISDVEFQIKKQNVTSSIIIPKKLITCAPQTEGKLSEIVGFHHLQQDILISYDYLSQTINQYNIKDGTCTSHTINTSIIHYETDNEKQNKKMQKQSVKDPIDPGNSQNKFRNLFEETKKDIENITLGNIQQMLANGDGQIILELYKDKIQIILHPILFLLCFVFKYEEIILFYCLQNNKIVQDKSLPSYNDKSGNLNSISCPKNPNLVILSYASNINFISAHTDLEKEFQYKFRKNHTRSVFECNETKFENWQHMNKDLKNIFYQNGATFKKDQETEEVDQENEEHSDESE